MNSRVYALKWLGWMQMCDLEEQARDSRQRHVFVLKRLFDVACILVATPVWLPIFCAVFAASAVAMGRPLFFSQIRSGLNRRPFRLLKFRTMQNLTDELGALLPDEKRLTRYGRFLRSTSLDELPEIWNVMCGKMSLVGPRPLLIEYLPLYTTDQDRRHNVLPGITGWTQINGRNSLDWDEKFALDLWYVDHCSFRIDVLILIKTVSRVLRRQGIDHCGTATMPKFGASFDREGMGGIAADL